MNGPLVMESMYYAVMPLVGGQGGPPGIWELS